MTQNGFRQLQLNFSGLGCWLTFFAVVWLITTVGLGWILKSIAVLFLVSLLLPVLIFIGVRIWLSRNWVQGSCPSCSQPLAGVKSMQLGCPNCGTRLEVADGTFVRASAAGTVDVDVVDIEEISNSDISDAPAIDVQVLPPSDEP